MHHHDEQQAAGTSPVQPSHRNRQRGDMEQVKGKRLARAAAAREEEQGQVPQRPHDAEDQARPREADTLRELRQREAAPADLLAGLDPHRNDDRTEHQR
jgi:hypothetical protein